MVRYRGLRATTWHSQRNGCRRFPCRHLLSDLFHCRCLAPVPVDASLWILSGGVTPLVLFFSLATMPALPIFGGCGVPRSVVSSIALAIWTCTITVNRIFSIIVLTWRASALGGTAACIQRVVRSMRLSRCCISCAMLCLAKAVARPTYSYIANKVVIAPARLQSCACSALQIVACLSR